MGLFRQEFGKQNSHKGGMQKHPYMSNDFKGTPEIQSTMKDIYEHPEQRVFTIDNRNDD